ncbi:glycosyltransferase family 4 protein [Parabacteroides sp. ZJ-118]|uniref:glycosyltransferase family 4 protein n=1 Tax=Parabacteroides sp. ZJ-118 TaxID=2709398 RepID=UPI0013ED43B4|nr:glycosyltransferase [Parabacteroides sp. ZJ-118]
MKILWITNIMLPPICKAMQMPVPAVGGWMYSSLKRLAAGSKHEFAVATVYSGNDFIRQEVNGITWYNLPLRGKSYISYNTHLESYWKTVKEEFKPDVVHIHGSEYPHGLAYVNACGSSGVVVSIQGIISRYARYYAAGIDSTSVKKCLTFRDIVKCDNLLKGQKSFEKRGQDEIRLLQSVGHIIGRTDWDKAHAWAINPDAQYHYCGETLRDSFYNHKWSYDKCEPHTIFVSQASYPIKGLHKLLEAMPLVLREYPDTKIYVAGDDPTAKPWWRITGYGKYLLHLINKLGLRPHITFTGMLSEEDMCSAYLRANLFVCPSAIENSPNSLGEAQIMGVPCIASYVGGIPGMMNGYERGGMYRFEEVEMLAKLICDFFSRSEYTGSGGGEIAHRRHEPIENAVRTIEIYRKIVG